MQKPDSILVPNGNGGYDQYKKFNPASALISIGIAVAGTIASCIATDIYEYLREKSKKNTKK